MTHARGSDRVFRALADPTRRRILDLLRHRPRRTGDLAERFDVSRFAVMKHLAVLVEAGLVVVVRKGRERWNHLNPVPIQELYRRWIAPFEKESADALLRLKDAAEASRKEKRWPERGSTSSRSSRKSGSTRRRSASGRR